MRGDIEFRDGPKPGKRRYIERHILPKASCLLVPTRLRTNTIQMNASQRALLPAIVSLTLLDVAVARRRRRTLLHGLNLTMLPNVDDAKPLSRICRRPLEVHP